MKMIDVPKLLDLDCQYATTGASAAPTEAFWAFYNGYRGEMPRNGISVRKTDGEWTVLFDLRWASPNRQSVIDTRVAEHRAFCAQRDERHQAERARMATEKAAKAAEQKQTALRHAEVLAVRLGPAIETSRQMLTKFGDFYDRKDKVRGIIARFDDPDADALGINDLNVLEDSIQATKNKHSRTLVLALKAKGGVDWPDDEVAAAITKLTLLDLDHAKERNHRGWDAIQSSYGHWCYAMLEHNREAAIRLGRTLVGTYKNTQLGRAA